VRIQRNRRLSRQLHGCGRVLRNQRAFSQQTVPKGTTCIFPQLGEGLPTCSSDPEKVDTASPTNKRPTPRDNQKPRRSAMELRTSLTSTNGHHPLTVHLFARYDLPEFGHSQLASSTYCYPSGRARYVTPQLLDHDEALS